MSLFGQAKRDAGSNASLRLVPAGQAPRRRLENGSRIRSGMTDGVESHSTLVCTGGSDLSAVPKVEVGAGGV